MNAFTSFDFDQLTQAEAHRFLLNAVVPRPICFASTEDANGKVNLSPFSFFNVFSSNPPILIFSPSRRGRDNTIKHTLENVKEVNEVVINMVDHAMVEQMSLSSSDYPKGVNEFEKAGFTPLSSQHVRPPRVKEAPIAFECIVDKIIPLGEGPGAGNLVIAKVRMMHVQNQLIDSQGELKTKQLDVVARMGGQWYVRMIEEAFFTLEKTNSHIGIGVDKLPQSIQNNEWLSGNDLGRLGSLDRLPNTTEVEHMKKNTMVYQILSLTDKVVQYKALSNFAQDILRQGKTNEALAVLFIADAL